MIIKLFIFIIAIGVLGVMFYDLFRECRKFHNRNTDEFWKKDING